MPDGAGGGDPAAFAFQTTDTLGRPARWDPCSAVRWGFNPDQAPPGALDLITQAIGRLATQSGLTFAYVGTTTYKPLTEGAPPSGFDAVVAFGGAGEYGEFAGGTFGLGGFTSTLTPEGPRIVYGGVALNSRLVPTIPDGFGPGQRRGGAVLHELGHMVGLAHVGDRSQLMFAALTPQAPSDYGAGDRSGLAKVGAAAGCFVAPAPPRAPAAPGAPSPPPPPPPPAVPASSSSASGSGELSESWTYCHLAPTTTSRGLGAATRIPA